VGERGEIDGGVGRVLQGYLSGRPGNEASRRFVVGWVRKAAFLISLIAIVTLHRALRSHFQDFLLLFLDRIVDFLYELIGQLLDFHFRFS
jgi:hypothetical protein